MATFDYKCPECDFLKEYNNGKHMPKDMQPPVYCPNCNEGKLEKQFSVSTHQGFDLIGPGFYINDSGKHAWKKNNSASDQADILRGVRPAY